MPAADSKRLLNQAEGSEYGNLGILYSRLTDEFWHSYIQCCLSTFIEKEGFVFRPEKEFLTFGPIVAGEPAEISKILAIVL